ncbi:hypothetical protein [Phenylobacterium sp.]|uniref:hypothetical protein n=1 Tax=Phenylobacterium sp. TaxID=1871053 RepID=UPI0030F46363
MGLALAVGVLITAPAGAGAQSKAKSKAQSAYDELCGAKPEASPATCAALKGELSAVSAASAAPASQQAAQSVLAIKADVRDGKANGFLGEKYAQHTYQARPGYYYKVKLTATDRVNVTLCKVPDPNSFACWGRLDNWTITDWEMTGDETVYVTVRGVKGKGAYQLDVEERPYTQAWEKQWTARNAVVRALSGQVFLGAQGTIVSFVKVGDGVELRIADTTGRFHRSAPLKNFQSHVGKGAFVFTGEEWVAKNVNTFNVLSMIGADSIATYYDWGFGDHFRILPSGDLQMTRFAGGAPQAYWPVRRLPADEAIEVTRRYADARRAQFQAAAQRRDDRDALIGQLFQGALIAGQAYAAGMQEAAVMNARSQAIIDEAAASDRRYNEARRAAALAERSIPSAPAAASRPAAPRAGQSQAAARPITPGSPAPQGALAGSSATKSRDRNCKKVSQVRYGVEGESYESMAVARQQADRLYPVYCTKPGWTCGAISCSEDKPITLTLGKNTLSSGGKSRFVCAAPAREEVTFCDTQVSSE